MNSVQKKTIIKPIEPEKILQFMLAITKNDKDKREMHYVKNLIKAYPNILQYMIKDVQPDLTKVTYVKNKRYNYIKKKVLANYDLLELNALLQNAFSFDILTKIKLLYDKIVLPEKLNEYIVNDLKTKPYDTLCRIKGIGFLRADTILLDADNKLDFWNHKLILSTFRCTSFLLWYLLYELNGSTYVHMDILKKEMINKYHLDDCIHTLNNSLNDYRIKVVNDNKVMLMSTYLEEQNISAFIHKALSSSNKYNTWDIPVENYKEIDSFTLNDNQLQVLDLICKNQIVTLNGYAGTGKSSSIKALINLLESNGKTYAIVAPTAKAAKTISNYTDRHASTIHYLLCNEAYDFDYHLDENPFNNISNLQNYMKVELWPMGYNVIIIDEMSMLSIELFNLLIRYIRSSQTKLLLIGDSYQLPSIQSGNLYHDLLHIDEIPNVSLDEIFRYTESGLINVATNIRLRKSYLSKKLVQHFGESYSFFECDDVKEMINQSLNLYLELIKDNPIEDVAILTAKNVGQSGTYVLNNLIQSIINPLDKQYSAYANEIEIFVDNVKICFRVNDIIMNIKNNYNAIEKGQNEPTLLANGQTGVVKSIGFDGKSMDVEIDNKLFTFNVKDIYNCRLGYAYTIHKSQGSQYKQLIYLTSRADTYMTSSNLMYVAVTRAKDKCYHFGVIDTVNTCIKKQDNYSRNTTLIQQFKRKW